MINFIIFCLFLYSSWAFVRIGTLERKIERLHKLTDDEFKQIWDAFTKYIKDARNEAKKNTS